MSSALIRRIARLVSISRMDYSPLREPLPVAWCYGLEDLLEVLLRGHDEAGVAFWRDAAEVELVPPARRRAPYWEEGLGKVVVAEAGKGTSLTSTEWTALARSPGRRALVTGAAAEAAVEVLATAQLQREHSTITFDQLQRIRSGDEIGDLSQSLLTTLLELDSTASSGLETGSLIDWVHLLVSLAHRHRAHDPARVPQLVVTLRELQEKGQLKKEETARMVARLAEIVTVPQLVSVQVSLLKLLDGRPDEVATSLLVGLRRPV